MGTGVEGLRAAAGEPGRGDSGRAGVGEAAAGEAERCQGLGEEEGTALPAPYLCRELQMRP